MKPTISDIQAVLNQFDRSDWDELRVDSGDFTLHVAKSPMTERTQRNTSGSPTEVAPASQHTKASTPATALPPTTTSDSGSQIAAPNMRPTSDGVVVKAPSIGTFYRSPRPGSPPFVETGAEVTAATQLCLLEVMKLYTAVEAEVDGVIVEILVEDGALVEHDQPLFVIRPHQS